MLNCFGILHRRALPLELKAWLCSTKAVPQVKYVESYQSSTSRNEDHSAATSDLKSEASNFDWRTWIGETNKIALVKQPAKDARPYIPDIRMFVPNHQRKGAPDQSARIVKVMKDCNINHEFDRQVSPAEKEEKRIRDHEIERQVNYDAKRNKYLSEEKCRVSERIAYLQDSPHMDGCKCFIKLLCPSLVTEKMHDSGNKWVNGIREKSGATIVLSPNGHCYPHTTDRVIAISGDYIEVNAAVKILVNDLIKPPGIPIGRVRSLNSPFIRILIPKTAVPALAGKGLRSLNRITDCHLDIVDDDFKKEAEAGTGTGTGTDIIGGVATANYYKNCTEETFLYIGCRSRQIDCLTFGVQVAVRQVLMHSDSFPYSNRGVLYGNEKLEPVAPRGSVNLNPVKKYTGLFAQLVVSHKAAKKRKVTA